MSALTAIGWAVVHSIWVCTLVAGLTAMALSLLRDRHARVRDRVACVSLALMVAAPLAVTFSGADVLGPTSRNQALGVVEGMVTLPTFLQGRAIVVPAAAVVWMIGVVVYLLVIAGEWRRARRLRQRGLDPPDRAVLALVDDLRSRLSVTCAVEVFRSALAGVPMVLGWRQPVILLPAGPVDQLTPAQLRAVLAHELAHVRRRDYIANVLQIVADALLVHHPAARWVSRRIRIEREYCCDDVAVTVSGDGAAYARALAALEDARGESRFAVAAASGTLLDRIQRIVGQPRPTLTPVHGVVALVTTSVLAAFVLALTAAVPPSMPLDARPRMRQPAPPGATLPLRPSDVLPRDPRNQSAPDALNGILGPALPRQPARPFA